MTASTLKPQLRHALLRNLNAKQSGKKNWLQKGFTLVELMIVIVIVGILSAVALPNFLAQTDKAKATECTTKLGAILSQGGAEGLADPDNVQSLVSGLATTESTNSEFCTITSDGVTGTTLTVSVVGKANSALAGKYDAEGCINWSTMKRDIDYKVGTGAAGASASCS